MKIKLAAIAKNEGAYIPQWIYHHLHFGFDFIEIWINNTTDNSVQILENIKHNHAGVVDFFIADELFNECLKNNYSFQIRAYRKIFEESKNNGFTHIIFLDIDEYWMPKNFITKIYSCVKDIKDADAISFKWYFDEPESHAREFRLPSNFHRLQKNRHVKTLIKISGRVKSIGIHNHVISDGLYSFGDGTIFEEVDADQQGRSAVPRNLFDLDRLKLDDYFILHTIYRSQKEYVASLLRGRPNGNHKEPFKSNRYGYIADKDSISGIEFNGDVSEIYKYESNFTKFCEANGISSLLLIARKFLQLTFEKAVGILRLSPDLIGSNFLPQMLGVRMNNLIKNKIISNGLIYSIDDVKFESSKNILIVTGWAFDRNSSDKVVVVLNDKFGTTLKLLNFFEIDRPDVVRAHPDAIVSSGFSAQFSIDNVNDTIDFCAGGPYFICLCTTGSIKKISLDLERFL